MLDQLAGFHIETTNICTLKCPKCARTEFINKFPSKWKNHQLNLDNLKSFIDIDIKGKTFALCGNYGDPIYYDRLIDLVDWLKQNQAIVKIVTNGSYKTQEWWSQLCSMLDQTDEITFAIDGIPSNFTKYRINADWNSIKIGIQEAVKATTVVWKYIPFSFNETDIETARQISVDLGMHTFNLDPSDRWSAGEDPLKPKNLFGPRYESILHWVPMTQSKIDPRCKKTNGEHFISADGFYMPCCFVGDHRFYYSSEFYKNKKKYDISTSTISNILTELDDFYKNITETNLKYCTFNCPNI